LLNHDETPRKRWVRGNKVQELGDHGSESIEVVRLDVNREASDTWAWDDLGGVAGYAVLFDVEPARHIEEGAFA
tara:strand:- start:24143 stop:24364 length:222 start_codon:yes stop_codon:yes gene_type:complete